MLALRTYFFIESTTFLCPFMGFPQAVYRGFALVETGISCGISDTKITKNYNFQKN